MINRKTRCSFLFYFSGLMWLGLAFTRPQLSWLGMKLEAAQVLEFRSPHAQLKC